MHIICYTTCKISRTCTMWYIVSEFISTYLINISQCSHNAQTSNRFVPINYTLYSQIPLQSKKNVPMCSVVYTARMIQWLWLGTSRPQLCGWLRSIKFCYFNQIPMCKSLLQLGLCSSIVAFVSVVRNGGHHRQTSYYGLLHYYTLALFS